MEYIGVTHELARNIYIAIFLGGLGCIFPLVTMILHPIKDRVVKQKERFRSEMEASTNHIIPSELCTLFDRLHVQEHKIEKIEWKANVTLWCCIGMILLAAVGIGTSLLRWQIDAVVFILLIIWIVGFVMSIIPSLTCYLNDDKK